MNISRDSKRRLYQKYDPIPFFTCLNPECGKMSCVEVKDESDHYIKCLACRSRIEIKDPKDENSPIPGFQCRKCGEESVVIINQDGRWIKCKNCGEGDWPLGYIK